jgi:hypothetical protein
MKQRQQQTDNLFDVANHSSYGCRRCGLPVIIAFIWQEMVLYDDIISEMVVKLLPLQTEATP